MSFSRPFCAFLFLVAGAAPVVARAETEPTTEHAVKAAFVYNFARFIDWPADGGQTGPFVFGFLGRDAVGSDLEAMLANKTVHDRPIVVRRLAGPVEARDCQVLYLPASEKNRLDDVLAAVDHRPVLLVSDMARFLDRGGMVELSVDDNQVHFSINETASEQANLKISSQLLKLAKAVKGAATAGKRP